MVWDWVMGSLVWANLNEGVGKGVLAVGVQKEDLVDAGMARQVGWGLERGLGSQTLEQ